LGKPYRIKVRSYWEHFGGTSWELHGGTHRQHDRNKEKKAKKSSLLPKNKKKTFITPLPLSSW
jgi:hypothetical protein